MRFDVYTLNTTRVWLGRRIGGAASAPPRTGAREFAELRGVSRGFAAENECAETARLPRAFPANSPRAFFAADQSAPAVRGGQCVRRHRRGDDRRTTFVRFGPQPCGPGGYLGKDPCLVQTER